MSAIGIYLFFGSLVLFLGVGNIIFEYLANRAHNLFYDNNIAAMFFVVVVFLAIIFWPITVMFGIYLAFKKRKE